MPMLCGYTENDQWMGPTFPYEWFDAFKEMGGGEFSLFPPHGRDSHECFQQRRILMIADGIAMER